MNSMDQTVHNTKRMSDVFVGFSIPSFLFERFSLNATDSFARVNGSHAFDCRLLVHTYDLFVLEIGYILCSFVHFVDCVVGEPLKICSHFGRDAVDMML